MISERFHAAAPVDDGIGTSAADEAWYALETAKIETPATDSGIPLGGEKDSPNRCTAKSTKPPSRRGY